MTWALIVFMTLTVVFLASSLYYHMKYLEIQARQWENYDDMYEYESEREILVDQSSSDHVD